MKIKYVFSFIVLLFLFNSLIAQINTQDKTSLTYLKSNLQVLASDDFEGRETSKHGEKLASLFISSELQKYGVKPFGDNGTYFQNFELFTIGYTVDSKISLMDNSNSTISTFSIGGDFVRSYGAPFPDLSYCKQSAKLVFTGYGITAKEFNYDDYSNLNVKGKVVLVLAGEPFSDNDKYFNGSKSTRYSSVNSKLRHAKEMGAVGLLVIADGTTLSFWNFLEGYATEPNFSLEIEKAEPGNIPVLIVKPNIASKILEGEKYSLEKINEILKAKESLSSFELNKGMNYSLNLSTKTVKARNVIGVIEGTDPVLKNEYVLLSSHYDHLGTFRGEVSNGADDDGSGTVAVLESARLLSMNGENKRSIITIFHTGEEKGLLGSRYASDNASFVKNAVADINIDMVGRESIDTIHCIGSNKLSAELGNIVKEENAKTVNFVLNYIYDDPNDPNSFYTRSDHYNYARKGIPIAFFFDDMRVDYHRPSDDIEKINFEKILKTLKLSVSIVNRIANMDHKPIVDKTTDNLPKRSGD